MREPTSRQKEVLDFIALYIETNSYPPTIREVAEHFSISVKGASDHLWALRKKGLLHQGDKKSRTMKLTKTGKEEDDYIEVPILGSVAAGRPILANENMDGSIRLHRPFVKKGREYFALRVKGDSMEPGIMEGDIAVIEQQSIVNNGEIAVVMVDDDLDEGYTLKRFYFEGSRIRLQPENSSHPVKYYTRDLQVLGRLVHIIRSYGNPS